MISCTEFIPAYSTLFTYLEKISGPEAVPAYWSHNFDYTKSSLYRLVSAEGIKGCYSYWNVTLNEEAADFSMYLDEKRGYYLLEMHHCPSKGRLLKLREDVGVEPYHGYCLHCDYYRAAIEACGLRYLFNVAGADRASCSILVYDPEIFDGRVIVDENTTVMHRTAKDNEYLHRSFHGSLNSGIRYLAEHWGEDAVREYLKTFADTVYKPVSNAAKENGLAAIEEKILDTYAVEHASDAVHTTLTDDSLTVDVAYCPAEKFLKSRGIAVSPYYYLTTEVVMDTVAKNAGYHFTMEHYDSATGAAKYRFTKFA